MKTFISRIISILLLQGFASSLFAHVELDNPLGGETFIAGQTVTIQWHIAIPHNTLNWDLLFSSDGGASWEFIQMDLPVGNLSYVWVVPSTLTSQARVSVIQDNSGADYQDESLNFTIAPPPMLPVIVLEAMDTTIESNTGSQNAAIQAWLDNHGGAAVSHFCNDLIWTDDFAGLTYTCGASGNAVVTFTATDDCGSTETVATVTVIDTSPPVLIQEPSPLLVECDGSGNTAQLNAWLGTQGGAIAIDAGASVSWVFSLSGMENGCGLTSISSILFTVIDECGNSTSTSSTFTIEDHTPPAIQTAAKDTIIECGLPNTQAVLQSWLNRQGGALASDVCSGVVWTNDFAALPDTCTGTNSLSVMFTATDICGNRDSTSASLTFLGTSGSAAPDLVDIGFNLSPNPVSHTLRITSDQPDIIFEHITLYDVCGKPLLTLRELPGEIDIPVNGYSPGIYLVQAHTTLGVMTRKVIIE